MCHTPPRVVTHRIWVLKPNRNTSQIRSTTIRTPTRPMSHQHRPTSIAAIAESTTCSHWSSLAGPKSATSGRTASAGNGANGNVDAVVRR